MRTLLLIPLLLIFALPGQNGAPQNDSASLTVLNYKSYKDRQVVEKLDAPATGPAAAIVPADKNFERNRRINDPAGVRDPKADTIDGRSAALEKSVQESRMPASKPTDGYAYRVKVQNQSAKTIEVIFWEYQFIETANPSTIARRQFLCGLTIKPGKDKEIKAFSVLGPMDVISVGSLKDKPENLFNEKVVINRVEYSDGSIWQRKDWNFAEIKTALARALGTPWGMEMCRTL